MKCVISCVNVCRENMLNHQDQKYFPVFHLKNVSLWQTLDVVVVVHKYVVNSIFDNVWQNTKRIDKGGGLGCVVLIVTLVYCFLYTYLTHLALAAVWWHDLSPHNNHTIALILASTQQYSTAQHIFIYQLTEEAKNITWPTKTNSDEHKNIAPLRPLRISICVEIRYNSLERKLFTKMFYGLFSTGIRTFKF